jgi:hypothetical protein
VPDAEIHLLDADHFALEAHDCESQPTSRTSLVASSRGSDGSAIIDP